MPRMTEEEADALDELLTRTTPRVDLSKPGVFAQQKGMTTAVDPAAGLRATAEGLHKTPGEAAGTRERKRAAVTA